MTDIATPEAAPTFPAAELDRRFYAFTIDRLIAWTVDGAGVFAAYWFLLSEDRMGAGIAVIVGTVLLVGLAFSLLLGLRGTSPGMAMSGLRVVHVGSGTPIGVPAAMLRTLILGVATLPTFGLGVATLAWTAVMDRERLRRGWHDHVTGSIVVDVRPVPQSEAPVEAAPRHIVNLTAMRLVPASQPVPVIPPALPARPTRTPAPAPASEVSPQLSPPPSPPPSQPPTSGPASPTPQPTSQPTSQPAPRRPSGPGTTAERTHVRNGRPTGGLARWRVTFDTGESFLVEGLALVGRRPEPRPGEPVRHLVPLPSGDMSLSKTHAQFQVAPDGVLVVMDRGSTNGSVLVRQGVSKELPAGKPTTLLTGDRVRFGDRQMTVAQEA